MCEVLRGNFQRFLPDIERDIRNSAFIAIDTEFTGLKLSEQQKPSLFDNGEARYAKLRKSIEQFSMSQIGLSAFVYDKQTNSYAAHTYNCYLYPTFFGPVDVRFSCQASSLQFLCKHNFDFNKFVYEGVPFMNEDQELTLRMYLESHDHIEGLDRDIDEKALQDLCSKVADWLTKAEEGDVFLTDIPVDMDEYMTITELRTRFLEVWPSATDQGKISIEKVGNERKEELTYQFKMEQEEKMLLQNLGFTRVFKFMVNLKKPLVGHNNLMDLMLLYDKFYKPLPEKYSRFKEEINAMFPEIYDTKHIASQIRRKFEETNVFESTGLGSLYKALDGEKGKYMYLYSPDIHHAEGFSRYIWIRIAHILAAKDRKIAEAMTYLEYVIALRPFLNCVNLIRGSVDHVRLDEYDPTSRRPQYLYIRSKKKSMPLTATLVAKYLSAYGSVDIHMKGQRHCLVAVGNHSCAKDILTSFRRHDTLRVTKYHVIKHAPLVRGIMWGGVFACAGMCVWSLYSGLQDAPS